MPCDRCESANSKLFTLAPVNDDAYLMNLCPECASLYKSIPMTTNPMSEAFVAGNFYRNHLPATYSNEYIARACQWLYGFHYDLCVDHQEYCADEMDKEEREEHKKNLKRVEKLFKQEFLLFKQGSVAFDACLTMIEDYIGDVAYVLGNE